MPSEEEEPGDEKKEVDPDEEEEPDEGEEEENLALDPIYAAFVRAHAINQVLIHSGVDNYPGGLLRFISVTDDSVSVRRTWQRGLAIGVRGLTLEVEKATGKVLYAGPMTDFPVSRSIRPAPVPVEGE